MNKNVVSFNPCCFNFPDDFDDAKKASIVSNILNDLKFLKSVLEKTLSGGKLNLYTCQPA